jgi:hypothetical protein
MRVIYLLLCTLTGAIVGCGVDGLPDRFLTIDGALLMGSCTASGAPGGLAACCMGFVAYR